MLDTTSPAQALHEMLHGGSSMVRLHLRGGEAAEGEVAAELPTPPDGWYSVKADENTVVYVNRHRSRPPSPE